MSIVFAEFSLQVHGLEKTTAAGLEALRKDLLEAIHPVCEMHMKQDYPVASEHVNELSLLTYAGQPDEGPSVNEVVPGNAESTGDQNGDRA